MPPLTRSKAASNKLQEADIPSLPPPTKAAPAVKDSGLKHKKSQSRSALEESSGNCNRLDSGAQLEDDGSNGNRVNKDKLITQDPGDNSLVRREGNFVYTLPGKQKGSDGSTGVSEGRCQLEQGSSLLLNPFKKKFFSSSLALNVPLLIFALLLLEQQICHRSKKPKKMI